MLLVALVNPGLHKSTMVLYLFQIVLLTFASVLARPPIHGHMGKKAVNSLTVTTMQSFQKPSLDNLIHDIASGLSRADITAISDKLARMAQDQLPSLERRISTTHMPDDIVQSYLECLMLTEAKQLEFLKFEPLGLYAFATLATLQCFGYGCDIHPLDFDIVNESVNLTLNTVSYERAMKMIALKRIIVQAMFEGMGHDYQDNNGILFKLDIWMSLFKFNHSSA